MKVIVAGLLGGLLSSVGISVDQLNYWYVMIPVGFYSVFGVQHEK